MNTIDEQILALADAMFVPKDSATYYAIQVAAALDRLAMARKWIESQPHTDRCPWRGLAQNAAGYRPPCTCGRDALLEALEMPR